MSLRRAVSLRISLIRSLLETELTRSSVCGLSSASMASHQQPLLNLRNFSAQATGSASFSTSSYLPRAAEAAQEPSPVSEPVFPDVHVRLESINEPYRVERRPVFAVVEVGGTQYKVTPDDVIVTEKLDGVDVNDKVKLQRVLLLGNADETVIGRPYVPGASVTAAVEEQFLDGKVIIFHKRRRKNSRRTKGHRQPLTTLRILSVEGLQEEEGAAPEAAGA